MTEDIYTQPLAVIRARRAAIKTERKRLDDEDVRLEATEKTLLSLRANPPPTAQLKTQKDYVLHALREQDEPVEWRALRDRVAALGKDIPPSSFQPLLSDMANSDKTIVRENNMVSLAT